METDNDRRLRVLIADDDPGVARSISRLLAIDHEVVGSVASGGELLEMVEQLQPAVIVLDLNLAGGESLEACRQITQRNPGIKVILFTVQDDSELRRRTFEAGAFAFAHKLVADDLLSAIKRCRTASVS